jgi:hypothetical protein
MVVSEGKYLFLKQLMIFWPDSAEEIIRLLEKAPFVWVMYCEDSVAEQLVRYAARRKRMQTILIDLSQPESELLADMDQTTRAYVLRKAEKIPHEIVVNEHLDEAQALLADFFRRKDFRGPLTLREWKGYLGTNDVFSIRYDGRTVATRVVLRDPPKHARQVVAATINRTDAESKKIVGALNRRLTWHEITYYKALGYRYYDFGGIARVGPLLGNAQFKSSFGGNVVNYNSLFLFQSALLRLGFQVVFQLRRQVRILRGRETGV